VGCGSTTSTPVEPAPEPVAAPVAEPEPEPLPYELGEPVSPELALLEWKDIETPGFKRAQHTPPGVPARKDRPAEAVYTVDADGRLAMYTMTGGPGSFVACQHGGVPMLQAVGPPQTRYQSLHFAKGCRIERDGCFVFDSCEPTLCSVLATTVPDAIAALADHLDNPQIIPFDWRNNPHVGDTFDLGDFRYQVTSIVPAQQVGRSFTKSKASPNATYLVVDYQIATNQNETTLVVANDIVMRDSKGRTFRSATQPTTSAALEKGIDQLLSELQPGIPRAQVAVFEVPNDALERIDLVIPSKAWSGGEVVMPLNFAEAK